MEIVENDFKLKSIDDSSPFFDLELLKIVNKGKSSEKKEFKNCAYGLTLYSAIQRIIQYRISCKHDVLDLKTYFSEYKKELDKLKKLLYEDNKTS